MPTRQAHVARRGATVVLFGAVAGLVFVGGGGRCCTGGPRAVKRCDGDSDASVRGVGEGETRYHAGGDGELRFVKW